MFPIAWSLRFARRLLLLALVMAGPAEARETQQLTLPAIDFARLLIVQGEYQAARNALELLHEQNPGDIETRFLLAEIALRTGDLPQAIAWYRDILADHPNTPRVRLELAAALFRTGDDANAEYHFRQALSQDLPPEVTRNVFRFLDQIRARKHLIFDVGVAIAPDTNVNTGSSQREVLIFGLPATLSDDAKRKSGVGISISGSGQYLHPIVDHWRLRVGALGYRTEYETGDFDDMFLRGYAGPQYLFEGGEVSLLGVYDRRWYANDLYFERYGPRIEAGYNVSQRLFVEGTAEYLATSYADQEHLDGHEMSFGFFPTYAVSESAYLTLVTGYGQERTETSFYDNDYYRIGIGYHQEAPYGVTLRLQPDLVYYRYLDDNPMFGARRRDHVYRVQVGAYKRDWHFQGFSPVLSYIYTNSVSNIDLYDYDRHQVQVGLTRKF